MDWINTEDRVPEREGVFLCFDRLNGIYLSTFGYDGKYEYWDYFGVGRDPTHWMLLPQPPNIKE